MLSKISKLIKQVCKYILRIMGARCLNHLRRELQTWKDGRLERSLRVLGWNWRCQDERVVLKRIYNCRYRSTYRCGCSCTCIIFSPWKQ